MSLVACFTQPVIVLFTKSVANTPSPAAALRMVSLEVFTEHSLIGWLLMGALAGWLSGELVRGKGFGCLGNILLGLIGAVIGGWLFEQLHITAFGFIGGLAAATVGAVLVVSLARALSGSH